MPATETAADASARHDQDGAAPGMATDPVCGMSVDRATARHRTEHAGKEYFFCGRRCLERFTAEPGRFVDAAKSAGPVASGMAEWTCPMHPEIVRDGPGSCPICGMALEPVVPTAEDADNPELRDMRRRFWVAAALSAPLVAIAMTGSMLDGVLAPRLGVWVQLV